MPQAIRDQRPFYLYGLTLISVSINNYMPCKVYGKITSHSKTSTMCPRSLGKNYPCGDKCILVKGVWAIKLRICHTTHACMLEHESFCSRACVCRHKKTPPYHRPLWGESTDHRGSVICRAIPGYDLIMIYVIWSPVCIFSRYIYQG